jgi:hypothetical protein
MASFLKIFLQEDFMIRQKKLIVGLVIALVTVSSSTQAANAVGTTTQAVPNAVDASQSSWLNITPGSDPSQLNFSWATKNSNKTNFTYKKLFSSDTAITAYSLPVPKVQIVRLRKNSDASQINFNTNAHVKTFYGATLKSVATESGVTKDAAWFQNKVTVSGLESLSIFAYRVGYDTIWSGVNTFKTGNPSSFNFIAVGDPQLGASTSGVHEIPEQKANALLYDSIAWQKSISSFTTLFPEASFVLSCGDQIENTKSISTCDKEYTAYFAPQELLGFPVATVCGNHEYGLGQYYGFHYNLPNQSAQYGATQYGNDGDYWFIYGDVLFILLNSNTVSVTTHDVFINQAIKANPGAKWRVVSFHHALFSNADHPFDSDVMFRRGTYPAIFDKYDIDVVFAGHDHQYSRSHQILDGLPVSKNNIRINRDSSVIALEPQGTVYFDLNSGSGSKYYDLNSSFIDPATGTITLPAYTAKFWQKYEPTFSNVSIDRNTFKVVTFSINNPRQPIDNYTIVKYRDPQPVRDFDNNCQR